MRDRNVSKTKSLTGERDQDAGSKNNAQRANEDQKEIYEQAQCKRRQTGFGPTTVTGLFEMRACSALSL